MEFIVQSENQNSWMLPPSSPSLHTNPSCIANDSTFGPWSNCYFDFTVFFEQCTLSCVSSIILILFAPPRIFCLFKRDDTTLRHPIRNIKLAVAITSTFFQLTLLLLYTQYPITRNAATIPSTVLGIIAALEVVALSYFEDSRSISPSSILSIYFLFSVVLDSAQVRSLYLRRTNVPIAALFSAVAALKLLLLVLEAQNKRSYLKPQYQGLSPESTSGIINRSFLWWLNGIFTEGSKNMAAFQGRYNLDVNLTAEKLGKDAQIAWDTRLKPDGQFTLVAVLWSCLQEQYFYVIFPRLCQTAFTFAQPFLITRVIDLLSEEYSELSLNEGYGLIGATVLIYLGIAVSSLLSSHLLFRFITMFRATAISLIYNRALFLQGGFIDESGAITLMSTDVDQITRCLEALNECWSRSIEVVIGVPLLARQLGWVSTIPLMVFLLSSIGSSFVAKRMGAFQEALSAATQHRITITKSMLSDMKCLKMMGLTAMANRVVQNERIKETKKLERLMWMAVWNNVVANIPFVLAPAATFAVYAFQAYLRGDKSFDAAKAFTSLALIKLVSNSAAYLLSAGPNCFASIGCFNRIQKFLLSEPRIDRRLLIPRVPYPLEVSDIAAIPEPLPSTEPSKDCSKIMVSVENTNIKPAKNAEIAVHVNYLSMYEGTTTMIVGPVGSGKTTLLMAILGEVPVDQGIISTRTKKMAYCSQTPWLPNGTVRQAILGFGDDRIIDVQWYETVVEACSLNYDFSKLPSGHNTRIGSRGVSLSGGQKQRIALARALYTRAEIFILDDVLSALDKTTEKFVVDKLFGKEGIFQKLNRTVIMVTHAIQYLPLADQVVVLFATDSTIQIGSFEKVHRAGFVKLIEREHWEEEPEETFVHSSNHFDKSIADDDARDLLRQTGDFAVYHTYFKTIGILPLFTFITFVTIYVFCSSFSQLWLRWWTDSGGNQVVLFICVYFLLSVGFSFGNGGYEWTACVWIGPSTGRKLHEVLLDVVTRAPQSFFTNTETGTIINKFSNDMSLVEGPLVEGLLRTISNFVLCLAEISLITMGSYYMALTIPLFMMAIYFLQHVYLKVSRQLRYLDLETRSPLYTHFLETLDGLSTIRAFGWEEKLIQLNREHLDDSQKPFYLLFCIQRWLGLALDLLIAALAVIVIALATSLRTSTSPGLLGVSLSNILSFNGTVSNFVTGWTILETSLGAIARLRDFEASTEVEAKIGEDIVPSKKWPAKGVIEIQNISASYDSINMALKDINLTILPGQKVGICGRTGSGKSSLISTLLRILDLSSGRILIDSVDLSTLPRDIIRSRLTAMPQDPLHLIGSVRFNADPLGKSTDEAMITALSKVGLWSVLAQRGGLDAELHLDSLSKGQQQLLALARAILHKSAILLLDEATSSVDGKTDQILQGAIRDEFKDCTVLTVAHRLETIMDSDIVVVMEAGKIREVGNPEELMKLHDSALRKLWGR